MLSTKREPAALCVPKLPLRQSTPGRIALSAVLLVGSTPSTWTNVHNASRRFKMSWHVPAVLATPQRLPASNRRSTSRRSGVIEDRKLERFSVPSRTRCHQVNIWCAWTSKASPSSLERPPRPRIASKSRHRWAQHTCRHRTGYQLYALYRSVTRMPENASPNSSRATWPSRDIRTKNTVTKLVTATHNQARLPPWRQLVSSRCATACACTYVRASSTGAATAAVVACSNWLIVPTLIGTPNTSSIACWVVRLDKRYAPVHNATVAWIPGPYVPLGTPAGHGARVTAPHAVHTNWCHGYAVTTGWMGGISMT